MPTISRNSGKTSTSKGKYSGKSFGGAKGTPRGRMLPRGKPKDITLLCIVQNNQETLQPDLRAC